MARRKIEQILANENQKINRSNDNQNTLSDNLLTAYFLDNINDNNNTSIDYLIINDFLYQFLSSKEKNKIYNLDEMIANLSKVDEGQLNKSKKKEVLIIPKIDIQIGLATDAYLDQIKNKKSLELISESKSKDDLKALLLIDRISSIQGYHNLKYAIDKKDSVEKKAIISAKYSSELSHLTHSHANLNSAETLIKNIASNYTLDNIKAIKKIDQEQASHPTNYNTITKNPKLADKIKDVKRKSQEIKAYTTNWLNTKLRPYLEKELNAIDYDISSIQNLHKAFEITRNASSQLNQLKQKYETAGIASNELNQKHNTLSAQRHDLGNYNRLKQEFATNYARLIKYRQLIKDARLEDISRLKLWVEQEKETKKSLNPAQTQFIDLNAAKWDYIDEYEVFQDTTNNKIISIQQSLNDKCNRLIQKAKKYKGLSGLFAEKDKTTLMGLKDDTQRLNNQIGLMKKEFGISDYLTQKSDKLDNLVEKIIKKNKYTYSQKLKNKIGSVYVGASLLRATYQQPKKGFSNQNLTPHEQILKKYSAGLL